MIPPIPDADPVLTILELLKDWNTLVPFARASIIVIVLVQLFKKLVPGFKYMHIVVTISAIFVGLLHALAGGMDWIHALLFILITSGGAVSIYQLFKHPLNRVFRVPSRL